MHDRLCSRELAEGDRIRRVARPVRTVDNPDSLAQDVALERDEIDRERRRRAELTKHLVAAALAKARSEMGRTDLDAGNLAKLLQRG